jgi:hypothetical protein
MASPDVVITEKCFGDMTLKKDTLVTAEGQQIYVIRLSPDGKYLALGDKQGMVEVSALLIIISFTPHLILDLLFRFERPSESGIESDYSSLVHLFTLLLGIHQRKVLCLWAPEVETFIVYALNLERRYLYDIFVFVAHPFTYHGS